MTNLTPELEASFKQMAADLDALRIYIPAASITIQGLFVALRRAGIDHSVSTAQLEEAQQIVEGLIQRHHRHVQELFHDARSGAKSRAGSSQGGKNRAQKYQMQYEVWKSMAKEIRKPDLGARAASLIIAKRCKTEYPEYAKKPNTIRPHISHLFPKKDKPS